MHPDLTFLATRARGSEIEMLRRLRTFQPTGRGSRGLIDAAALIGGRRKLVFVISDFYMPHADIEAAFGRYRTTTSFPSSSRTASRWRSYLGGGYSPLPI